MVGGEAGAQDTELVFLAAQAMFCPLRFAAFQQVFPPRPLLPSEGYSWSHTTRAAPPRVTEAQRVRMPPHSPHIFRLAKAYAYRVGDTQWYISYPKPNAFLSTLLYKTLNPVTVRMRAYMAEKKEPGHQTGVQVPAQRLSSCVTLDFISLSLESLIYNTASQQQLS